MSSSQKVFDPHRHQLPNPQVKSFQVISPADHQIPGKHAFSLHWRNNHILDELIIEVKQIRSLNFARHPYKGVLTKAIVFAPTNVGACPRKPDLREATSSRMLCGRKCPNIWVKVETRFVQGESLKCVGCNRYHAQLEVIVSVAHCSCCYYIVLIDDEKRRCTQ